LHFTEIAAQRNARSFWWKTSLFDSPVENSQLDTKQRTSSLKNSQLDTEHLSSYWRPFDGCCRPRLLGQKTGESSTPIANLLLPKSLCQHFDKSWTAGLGYRNCHGRGAQALAVTIALRCPQRSSGLAGPRWIICKRKSMSIFLP